MALIPNASCWSSIPALGAFARALCDRHCAEGLAERVAPAGREPKVEASALAGAATKPAGPQIQRRHLRPVLILPHATPQRIGRRPVHGESTVLVPRLAEARRFPLHARRLPPACRCPYIYRNRGTGAGLLQQLLRPARIKMPEVLIAPHNVIE